MEQAAVSLAISLASPVIVKLGNFILKPHLGGDVTEAEIKRLTSVNIPLILSGIRATENTKAEELKPWLLNLKEIAYEAEDLLDRYEYNRIENEMSSLPSSLKKIKKKAKEFFSPVMLKTELRTILDKIEQSAKDAKQFNELRGLVSNESTIQPGSVVNQQSTTVSGMTYTVFGRNEERDYLINLLIHETNESTSCNTNGSKKRIPVYSLYGIGGAGKTTLAQYIYNDERVKSYFDERVWIDVSPKFNAEKITKEIIHSLNRNVPSTSRETLNSLQNDLKQILPSKKILLVLDNIWCEKKELWDQLLIPFSEVGEYRCRILITARSEKVGLALNVNNNIRLKELENDDCLKILIDNATDDSWKIITNLELVATGEKIVEKVKKSPLALRFVGNLLGKKIDVKEWKQILKQDMLKETMDVLLLSFQNLPKELQRCFAYCSLYPKGYLFTEGRVKHLIRKWIAVGFVEPMRENTPDELGMKYLDGLVSCSFFQKSSYGLHSWYNIHDLLHDLAELVSKDSCFRIESDEQLTIPPTIKHLSIVNYKEGILRRRDILNLVNLRSLIVHATADINYNFTIGEFEGVCTNLTKLRVLYLSDLLRIQRLDSIGKLEFLRYLSLYDGNNSPLLGSVKQLPILYGRKNTAIIGKLNSILIKPLRKLYFLQYLQLPNDYEVTDSGGYLNMVKGDFLQLYQSFWGANWTDSSRQESCPYTVWTIGKTNA